MAAPASSSSSSSSRNASRRLLKELETWNTAEAKDERGIERLGPVRDDELLSWEAVINGSGIGGGYDGMCIVAFASPAIYLSIFLSIYSAHPAGFLLLAPLPSVTTSLLTGTICRPTHQTAAGSSA
jgi:peroxin-4